MGDVTVDLTGEMETPKHEQTKSTYSSVINPVKIFALLKTWIFARSHNVRPWFMFLQTSNFKPPSSIAQLSRRLMRNIEYFQGNYMFVFFGLIGYCLLTSPLFLIAIAGTGYAGYKLSQRHAVKKITLFGRELSIAQIYGLVALCSLPIYHWIGAGSIIFWVIGASFFVISLHAVFYNIENLDTDENFGLTMEEVQDV